MTDEEKYYTPTKVEELDRHVNAVIKKYESDGNLTELAKQLAENKSPIKDTNANLRAKMLVAVRLREMAGKEKNEFAKAELERLQARLWGTLSQTLTAAGTIPGIMNDINKFLPTAEFVRKQTEQQLSEVQDNALTEQQRKEIKEAAKSVSELIESDEVQKAIREQVEKLSAKQLEEERRKVYEAAHGKDKTEKLLKLRDSLTMKEEEEC